MLIPGSSLRAIAARFGLGQSSVVRHKPHMAMVMDQARALREVESVGELYKRQMSRSKRLWDHAAKILDDPAATSFQVANAARLADVARKIEEALAKFAQAPGYRDAVPSTQINAPEARIVVTTGLNPPQLDSQSKD